MRRQTVVGFLLLLSIQLIGQKVDIRVDSTRFPLGTELSLYLEARCPEKPELLTTESDIQGDIPMIRWTQEGSWTQQGSSWQWEQRFVVYDTGTFVLPPLEIGCARDTLMDTLETLGIPLTVYFQVDEEVVTDIKEIYKEPLRWIDFLWVLYLIGGVLALGLMWRFREKIFGRKAPEDKVEEVLPPRPAHEVALEELADLERAKLWQTELKEHYTRLSMILRRYLEDGFAIPAPESTTSEIVAEVRKLSVLAPEAEDLRSILYTSDMVKYAKATIPEKTHVTQLVLARQWIEKTMNSSPSQSEEE